MYAEEACLLRYSPALWETAGVLLGEEEMNLLRLTINFTTGYATTDVTLTVSTAGQQNAQDLVPGDLLLVEGTGVQNAAYNNEIMVVSSVTSSSVFVVARAYGANGSDGAATGIANGATLTKIGNVFAEGTTSPNVTSRNPTKLFNYCQIFKTAYELTNTAKKTKTRTGDALKNDKKRKMFDHSVAIEQAMIFGRRWEGAGANGKPQRMSGGILHMMAQYFSSAIKRYTTTPTVNAFLDDIYTMWDYDTEAGGQRIGLCGNGALNSLNKLAMASSATRINFDGYVTVYGMKLARWVFPQGEILLRTHPLFNTHARFTNDILIVDPTVLKWRYMRDTVNQDNIQANDADTQKGQWLTEGGLEFNHAKTSKYLSNFVV